MSYFLRILLRKQKLPDCIGHPRGEGEGFYDHCMFRIRYLQ